MKNTPNCIFNVNGVSINKDFTNVSSIETLVVPNIGDEIYFNNQVFKVHKRLISYKMVEDYELTSNERGREMIYIFV